MEKYRIFLKMMLKKAGKNILVIFGFVLVVAFSLNLMLIIYTDYSKNFMKHHENLESEHNVMVFSGYDSDMVKDSIREVLEEKNYDTDYELDDVIAFSGKFKNNNDYCYAVMAFANKRDILDNKTCRVEIIGEDKNITDGIYLPYMQHANGAYKTGDMFTVKANGEKEYTFPVAGFYATPMNGTVQTAVVLLILSENYYAEVAEDFVNEDVYAGIRITNPEENCIVADFDIPESVTEKMPDAEVIASSTFRNVKISRGNAINMYAAIIGSAVLIIFAVACVMVSITISNFIKDELRMMGILKALGYTGREMKRLILVVFQISNTIAVLCGIGLTYVLFPTLNGIFEKQTGLPYTLHFALPQALITFAGILVILTIVMLAALKKIETIDPVMAILAPPNVKQKAPEELTLAKSKRDVNTSFALCNIATNMKQTVSIFLTVTVSTLLLVFIVIMYDNCINNPDFVKDVVFGAHADGSITISEINEEKCKEYLDEDDRIISSVMLDTINVSDADTGIGLTASVQGDANQLGGSKANCIGRLPNNKKEIAIGVRYAYDHDIEIGDTMTIKYNGKEEQFTVCGYTQFILYPAGMCCNLTREGFERFETLPTHTYFFKVAEGVELSEVLDDINEELPVISADNERQYYNGMIGMYIDAIKAIMIVIGMAGILISLCSLYQMVNYILSSRMKEYGIMKAIGYTSKDLMKQTLLTAVIPVLVAIVTGTIVGALVTGKFFNLLMFATKSSIITIPFAVNIWGVAGCGVLVLVMMLVFGYIMANKSIVNIDAQKLITME